MCKLFLSFFLIIQLFANPVDDSTDILDNHTIKGATSTAANLVISKDDPNSILKQGGLSVMANTIGGYGASQIGAQLDGNLTAQTAAHFLSGGVCVRSILLRIFICCAAFSDE